MPVPAKSTAVEGFIDFDDYCDGALLADPETKHLAKIVQDASRDVEKAEDGRRGEKRKMIRAVALRDFSFRKFLSTVDAFERKARAEFPGGTADKRYKVIFAIPLGKIARLSIESRERILDPFVLACNGSDLPRELEKPGLAVAASWQGYIDATRALGFAESCLAKARDKVDKAKEDNVTALNKLEGELKRLFPSDLPRVRSYFPPASSRLTTEARVERAARNAEKAAEKAEKAKARADALADKARRARTGEPGPVASGTAGGRTKTPAVTPEDPPPPPATEASFDEKPKG